MSSSTKNPIFCFSYNVLWILFQYQTPNCVFTTYLEGKCLSPYSRTVADYAAII